MKTTVRFHLDKLNTITLLMDAIGGDAIGIAIGGDVTNGFVMNGDAGIIKIIIIINLIIGMK